MVQLSDKKALRRWAKQERSKLDMEALSKQLVKKLKNTNEYQQAENVLIFYPLEHEVNLLELLEDSSKNFYLPKIDGKNLLCCPYAKGEELCESCFRTKEPLSNSVDKNLIDLAIIPALAVDKNNYRLGYGGGFYDRFLIECNTKKIVCIPKQLIIETIIPNEFDIPADIVLTV